MSCLLFAALILKTPSIFLSSNRQPSLTQWHADTVALGVQQSSYLSQVAVPLAVILVHGALQQVGIIGVEYTGNPLFRALHKNTRLLRVHEVPHTLVGLVARVLQTKSRS